MDQLVVDERKSPEKANKSRYSGQRACQARAREERGKNRQVVKRDFLGLTPPSSATEAGHVRLDYKKKLDGQPLFAGARG